MVKVYGIKINYIISNENLKKLKSIISEEKNLRLSKFKKLEDIQRTLMGDVIVKFAINKLYKIPTNQLDFSYNPFGKPYLKNLINIHFNISHSGDWVVLAIGDTPVGIDVEQIVELDIDIASKIFSKSEYERLVKIPDRCKLQYFYKLWTLKESYIKALGVGLSIEPKTFSINVNNYIQIEYSRFRDKCFFKQSYLEQDYSLAICTYEPVLCDDIEIINFNEIIEFVEGYLKSN